MSNSFNNAELIRTRLITAPTAGELETILDLTALADAVLVERQKNILPTVQVAVAKTTGTAITIRWEGWTVADANARRPRLAHRYVVTVWSKPVIAGDELAADDVIESALARLWHWVPAGHHAFGEAQPGNGGLVPDRSFLIYDFEVVIPISH